MAKTCIYYDVEEATREDIARARTCAPQAVEFMAKGTSWPTAVSGPVPIGVPNPREFGYQEELMDWIERLFQALDETPARDVLWPHPEVSLLEIVRYQFLFEFASVEQRWRALSEILQTGTTKVVWVAPGESCQHLEKMATAGVPANLEFLAASRTERGPHPLWRRARALARTMLDRLSNLAARTMPNRRSSAPKVGTPVVFVEYYPNNARVVVPVAKELRDAHGLEGVWLATRKPVKRALDELGVSSLGLRQLAPRASGIGSHFGAAARKKLRDSLDALNEDLFCGTGSVAGKPYLLPSISDLLITMINEAAFWLAAFGEAFDHLRPRSVVSTTYSGIVGRAAAMAGRTRGAPSVYVQHGMFPDCDFFTRFCNDFLILWGDANRRTMLRNGIPESRIRVVGATIYDELARSHGANGRIDFPRAGEMIQVVYFASRTAGLAVNRSSAQLCLSKVAEAISRMPNARLTVKVHPGDKTGMVPKLLKGFPKVAVVHSGSSQDMMRQCDVAIVVSSTTGLEACMANKPLVVLQAPGVPDYGPYEEYGAALRICLDDPAASQAIADAIQSLSVSPDKLSALAEGRRRLIDDLLSGGTGNATELTAKAIAEIVELGFPQAQQLNTAK